MTFRKEIKLASRRKNTPSKMDHLKFSIYDIVDAKNEIVLTAFCPKGCGLVQATKYQITWTHLS